jgi:hypothetical protein
MTRLLTAGSWSVALLLGVAALGCTPGGVGDPCTPEDEYSQDFNGFQVTETNVESRSFQCETRLCLVNHFQGRVSCRLGQTAAEAAPYDLSQGSKPENAAWKPKCSIPGTAVDRRNITVDPVTGEPAGRNSPDNVRVEVPAQLQNRQTEDAVYCSCRCDGPEKNARYCECPEGFQCKELVENLKITSGQAQLAGSYCIRSGSDWKPTTQVKGSPGCDTNPAACGCTGDPYDAECGTK